MKRIFTLVMLVALSLGAMAQSPVLRYGNHYAVDGTNMNSREFKGFLKNTCPEAFNKYKSGYNVATAGWVQFGLGLGLEAGGIAAAFVGGENMVNQEPKPGPETKVDGGVIAGPLMYVSGALVLSSGIICLAVGYARMHNTVDLYNMGCAKHKPVAEFRVTGGANGLGLACRF